MLDNKQIIFFTLASTLLISSIASNSIFQTAFAQSQTTPGFTVLTGEQLKNNPFATNILDRIEQSKIILAQLQSGKKPPNEHQKFIEEQRTISKERLNADLARMNKQYENYTPRAAFGSFLSGINGTYHNLYWDQFNYLDNKIQIARSAMNDVLQNGGSYQEARQAYFKYASMTKVEMIKVNQDLNIKHGFADASVQKMFDKYGKLPRTEN